MSYNADFLDGCPAPFYNAGLFPSTMGSVESRICLPQMYTGTKTCCLPCPATQWIFSSNYKLLGQAAAGINIASLALLLFVLISYVFLPVQYTRSHYLNTSIIISVIFINLGFIVPFADNTDPCANAVTPSDMFSSVPCAFSGAFILAGGLCAIMWVLVRALSMHLQICWDITPGPRFFYLTQLGGWAIPAAIFTAAMSVTGVSFRFGPGVCHINHDRSIIDFWAWILAMAGIAIFIQLGTLGFCFNVYLRNIWADEDGSGATGAASTSAAPTYSSSQRAPTARAIYRRLKRVLWLQWRGLTMVTIMLVDVVFFAVVFVLIDRYTTINRVNETRATPWIMCLVKNPNSPEQCQALGQRFLLSEGTLGAVLFLLSTIGIFLSCLLLRWSFFTGWRNWFANIFGRGDGEFESIQSHNRNSGPAMNQDGINRQGLGGAMFEMQSPSKEYGHEGVMSKPSISSFDSPVKEYNTSIAAQYPATSPYAHQGAPQGFYNVGRANTTTVTGGAAAVDSPQMPMQSFTHPNPNIARLRANAPPAPSQGYGYFDAPAPAPTNFSQPGVNNSSHAAAYARSIGSPYDGSPNRYQ